MVEQYVVNPPVKPQAELATERDDDARHPLQVGLG